MTYTVIWKPAAEQELARLWTLAPDRRALTIAADAIDAALKKEPLTLGESRSLGVRLFVLAPLIVHFTVDESDRKVYVLDVWRSPP